MRNRYTAFDLNHRQVGLCSQYRKLLNKLTTAKNRRKMQRIKRQLGMEE